MIVRKRPNSFIHIDWGPILRCPTRKGQRPVWWVNCFQRPDRDLLCHTPFIFDIIFYFIGFVFFFLCVCVCEREAVGLLVLLAFHRPEFQSKEDVWSCGMDMEKMWKKLSRSVVVASVAILRSLVRCGFLRLSFIYKGRLYVCMDVCVSVFYYFYLCPHLFSIQDGKYEAKERERERKKPRSINRWKRTGIWQPENGHIIPHSVFILASFRQNKTKWGDSIRIVLE